MYLDCISVSTIFTNNTSYVTSEAISYALWDLVCTSIKRGLEMPALQIVVKMAMNEWMNKWRLTYMVLPMVLHGHGRHCWLLKGIQFSTFPMCLLWSTGDNSWYEATAVQREERLCPNSGTWYICKCLDRWCSHLCSLWHPSLPTTPEEQSLLLGKAIAVQALDPFPSCCLRDLVL